MKVLLKKNTSDGKEMSENMNDNKIGYASVEDPLNIHRSTSNDTTLVSEIPNIINEENVITAPRQGKKTISVLSDKFCEEQRFLSSFYG